MVNSPPFGEAERGNGNTERTLEGEREIRTFFHIYYILPQRMRPGREGVDWGEGE
jgi:hypothetical protein